MSDLLLYGAIGWDVVALDTVREISKARGTPLNVRINSPGGYVWEGLAIANAVRGHGSATTFVDGLAASMGSVIFLAGTRRVMAEGSRLMIHNPTSYAGGESGDLRKEADVLDGIADDMAEMYSNATGGKVTKKKAREMMDAETWLSPSEAVEMGFAHAIEGKATAWAKIPATMQYKNTPKEIAMENEKKEPSLLERMVAKFTVDTSAVTAQLNEAAAALGDASAKLVNAEARIATAEARAAELEAELESTKVAHAAALAEAVAAARIEGAQEFAAQNLKASAPEALPHVEENVETFSTHSAKWESLHAAGDYKAAGEYYSKHKNLILEGK